MERKVLNGFVAAVGIVVILFSGILIAQEGTQDLESKIEVLTEEIEKLKLGAVAEPKYESFMGLGPAASKIYGLEKGMSLGGYGETVYSNYQHSSKKDFADNYRFILYAGYKFNDWILMNTELEFEHAGIGNSDAKKKEPEVYTEFSYLDFLLKKSINVRAGLMLMPIGIVNEYHEPTVYQGVFRPDLESNLIPSTWREIGVMAYGSFSGVKYEAALVNGLRSNNFKAGSWFRSGRQQGAKVNAGVLGRIMRITAEPLPGLSVGGSFYSGQADEGKGGDEDKTTDKTATVRLWEINARYRLKGLYIAGVYATGALEANDLFKSDSNLKQVGKEAGGWYLEAGYDIMPYLKPGREMSLTPFVRYEAYDTNKAVFNGVTRDKSLDRTVLTCGLGFKPHPLVVIKTDYQLRDTASSLPEGKGTGLDENKIDQFNLGVGFIY